MSGKLHAAPFDATAFLHSRNVRLWVISQKIFPAGRDGADAVATCAVNAAIDGVHAADLNAGIKSHAAAGHTTFPEWARRGGAAPAAYSRLGSPQGPDAPVRSTCACGPHR